MTTMLDEVMPGAPEQPAGWDIPRSRAHINLLSDAVPTFKKFGAATDRAPTREERLGPENWGRALLELSDRRNRHHQWMIECVVNGAHSLRGVVEIDPHIRGGVPVLKGTRFPISQILAELSETSAVSNLASDFDLDGVAIRTLLEGLALIFQQSAWK